MVICNFEDPPYGHLKPCHHEAKRRVQKNKWDKFRHGGELNEMLLEYLWGDDRFKAHKAELLKLMEHFGLVVPIRRKEQQTYIVPALLALSAGANPPSTPDDAPLATLHFALASQAPPDTEPVWAPDDCERGFLPDGAFFELCGAAVGWSYHTARGFTPALGCGFAHVKFGRHELLLSRSDGAPYITVAILNAGGDLSPSAWSPAIDRLRLLVLGISSRFVNLRCTCLLPLSSVDEAEKRHVERGALLAADIDGSQVYYVGNQQPLTTRELASRLSAYLPPLKPPDHYGAFLSYSHVPAFDVPSLNAQSRRWTGHRPPAISAPTVATSVTMTVSIGGRALSATSAKIFSARFASTSSAEATFFDGSPAATRARPIAEVSAFSSSAPRVYGVVPGIVRAECPTPAGRTSSAFRKTSAFTVTRLSD